MTTETQKTLAQLQRELAEEILKILAISRSDVGEQSFEAMLRAIAYYTITIRQ